MKSLQEKVDSYLGPLPGSHIPWKEIIKNPFREAGLKTYFTELSKMENRGAKLALQYAQNQIQVEAGKD